MRILICWFGELAKDHQLKTNQFKPTICVPMTLNTKIAKFNFHQYVPA